MFILYAFVEHILTDITDLQFLSARETVNADKKNEPILIFAPPEDAMFSMYSINNKAML